MQEKFSVRKIIFKFQFDSTKMKFASVLLTLIFIACVRCANTQTPNNQIQ